MTYEELLIKADINGLTIKEKPIKGNDGRIIRNRIAIRKDIPTQKEKACILAEELGHYYTTTGDILDQSKVVNRKQERRARLWAYKKMITMDRLLEAKRHGCRNRFEIAEYLDVTEEFIQDTVDSYKQIYGPGYHQHGDYLICFEPLNIYYIA